MVPMPCGIAMSRSWFWRSRVVPAVRLPGLVVGTAAQAAACPGGLSRASLPLASDHGRCRLPRTSDRCQPFSGGGPAAELASVSMALQAPCAARFCREPHRPDLGASLSGAPHRPWPSRVTAGVRSSCCVATAPATWNWWNGSCRRAAPNSAPATPPCRPAWPRRRRWWQEGS
jgi:hypothetical protein